MGSGGGSSSYSGDFLMGEGVRKEQYLAGKGSGEVEVKVLGDKVDGKGSAYDLRRMDMPRCVMMAMPCFSS